MALIQFEDFFAFDAYRQAIKDAEKANTEFGTTITTVTNRIKQDYAGITAELKPFVETFKNFNVSQKGAVESLNATGNASATLVTKLEAQKKVLADVAATNNLLETSITDLKTANKALETEYNSLNSTEEKDILRKKEILAELNRITPALQTQTQIMKTAKTAVDAADGSYNKMSQELKQIGIQLRALPNAFDPVTGKLNKNNAEAVALNATYLKLNTSLKSADAGMGVFFRNVGNYEGAVEKLTEGIGHFASGLLLAVGIIPGLFGIVKFLEDSTEEFNAEQVAMAQFENILKNIDRNDAFDRLREKAEALANEFKTFEDKDVILVFQQLIQYGKLTEHQIDQLTPVIINFATLTHQSLEDATNTILKSLEGNNRGLKQFGINIREAKNTTEAFGLVMSELAPRVEGAAKAFGDTTAGQIKKTEVQIQELKETIGEQLQPAIKLFYQTISDGLKGIPQIFDTLSKGVNGFGETLKFNIQLLAEFAKGGAGDAAALLVSKNAENLKIQNDLNDSLQRTEAHKNAISVAEEAATKPLKEQETLLRSNESILATSKKIALDLNKENKSNTAEGRKATLQLIQDLEIVEELRKSIENQKDKRVLGLGDPSDPFKPGGADTAAAKAKAAFERRVKEQEDALKGQFDYELKLSEQLLAEQKIDDVGYLQTRFNLTKEYVSKASDIERTKGKDADLARLSELRKLEQDALNDLTKARIKKGQEFNQLDIELQQKRIEAETNLAVQGLKAEAVVEIATKGQTDLSKAQLELEYQDKIDKIVIDGLRRRAALETNIGTKQKFEDDIKALEQGIKERNRLFSDVTEPNEFYKLGIKYITDQYDLKRSLGLETIQDEIDKYDKLIELAKTYNKNSEELEKQRTTLIKQQQQQILESFRYSMENLSSLIGQPLADFFSTLTKSFEDVMNGLTFKDSFKDWANVAIAAGNIVNDQFHQASDDRIRQYELEKQRELKLAGTNEEAKAAIEEKFAKKVAQEKRKQAVFDKATALFQIAINTAVALASPANLAVLGALTPIILALGIAEAAIVAARPIPQFKTGTKNAPEGPALVDEAGYELVVDKHGQLKEVGTDKGARVTYLNKGDKVYTHTETKQIIKNIEKETELTKRLSNTIQGGRQAEAIYTMSKAMQNGSLNHSTLVSAFKEAVKTIPIYQTIFDERGVREREKRANDTITYLNKQSKF